VAIRAAPVTALIGARAPTLAGNFLQAVQQYGFVADCARLPVLHFY
jgi:hypothetical protein